MTQRPVAVLVGAPGAGKTTVGRELAERLGVEFIDVDSVIAQESGKSIPDIFVEDGEAEFRRLEKEAVITTLGGASGVVSLGGGAVIDPEVRAALADHRVVWLRVSAAQAASRVGLTGARPLLMGNVRGTLIALLEERTALYAEVGEIVVDTDGRSIADIVADILANVEAA
jgi:Shikimate kinase